MMTLMVVNLLALILALAFVFRLPHLLRWLDRMHHARRARWYVSRETLERLRCR